MHPTARCYIVPPHLLRGIAESIHNSDRIRKKALTSLAEHDRITKLRKDRLAAAGASCQPRGYNADTPIHALKEALDRAIYDAKHSSDESKLPGTLVRSDGEKVKDKAVNEAYDNVGTVLEFYKKRFD